MGQASMNNSRAMGQDYTDDGGTGTIKIGAQHYSEE